VLLLWYLLLLVIGWFALWAVAFFYVATTLCPRCGGELESRYSYLRGTYGSYCKSCSYGA
jgi:hypothetical protein